MTNNSLHKSVLKKEVIQYLSPKKNENFIDATVGDGGHSFEIIKRIQPNGKIFGIDWDSEMIHRLNLKIKNKKLKNLILVNDNFKNLKKIVEENNFKDISGILFDLGFSSWHIEESKKGFSFQKDEILDMRYFRKSKIKKVCFSKDCKAEQNAKLEREKSDLKAMDIINKYSEEEIEEILREYGEEGYSRRIAEAIVEARKKKPIIKTLELVEIIKKVVPKNQRINPATKTFQALRIVVNQELDNLKEALPQAIEVLKEESRIVIISFHSLEDRIVKNFFKKEKVKGKIKVLTKKPIVPTNEEVKENPRSRSAKLRAAKVI